MYKLENELSPLVCFHILFVPLSQKLCKDAGRLVLNRIVAL